MVTDSAGLPSLQVAALLHDIGKFWQRSGERHSASYDMFDQSVHGAHGAHAKWSAEFIERYVPGKWRGNSFDVLSHHKPASRTGKVIALADWLSSAERETGEPDQEATVQLLSIFSRLQGSVPWTAKEAYYPLSDLSLRREALFPREELFAPAEARRRYGELWSSFQSEVEKLPDADFEAYFVALYHLMEKYTWCMPAAGYRQVPDVSLFDHSRTTCAIASCLWLEGIAEEELDSLLAAPRRDADWRTERFCLISGDISGVQRFIYTITSKGAARGLRGRSFYLQLLGEVAADYVLCTLGLPIANLLYVGGGRFFILAPLSAREQLARIRQETSQGMLRAHRGDLYLALGAAPLAPQDFLGPNFGRKWREASVEADADKRRKMAEAAKADYAAVFGQRGKGGPVATGNECDACGSAIGENGDVLDGVARCRSCAGKPVPPAKPVPLKICDVCLEEVDTGDISGSTLKCEDCADFEDLGRQVADARDERLLLSLHRGSPPRTASGWQWKLWQIGRAWFSFSDAPEPGCLSHTIEEVDFVGQGCQGFRFLASVTPRSGRRQIYPRGGNARTVDKGDIKEFSLLAKDAVGVERLGVLRMDMDDLGLLFRSGLGQQATISRVSSLSFHLRNFFEGWLNVICEEVQRDTQGILARDMPKVDEERLYMVYSGGDDLFIVGAWDRLPILAETVRRDLGAFAAGNPNVHISAGIVLAEEHFPLYQAAEAAHAALDGKAKKFSRANGAEKNALCFLDTIVGWEDFAKVKEITFAVQRLVGEGVEDRGARKTVPRALTTHLGAIYRQYEQDRGRYPPAVRDERDRVYYGRWMWLAAYSLRRLIDRLRSPGRVLETGVESIQKELTNPAVVRNLGLVARWSELLVRDRKEGGR